MKPHFPLWFDKIFERFVVTVQSKTLKPVDNKGNSKIFKNKAKTAHFF